MDLGDGTTDQETSGKRYGNPCPKATKPKKERDGVENQKREKMFKKRGIHRIPPREIKHFNKILDQAKRKCSLPAAPAMPTRPAYMMAMLGSDPDGTITEP